jgi:hypothetical protein
VLRVQERVLHACAQAIAVGGGGRGRGDAFENELSFGSFVVLLESFEPT